MSESKAISSEEEHSLNAIICRIESGHYFIEARNKHGILLSESSFCRWSFNCAR